MKPWLMAALAVSFGACVACGSNGSSSDPEDMSIPDKLSFTPAKESKDKAQTDKDVAEFEAMTKGGGVNLDLIEAIKHNTRIAETDATKEKDYQDGWNKQNDLTKGLASALGAQVQAKDCTVTSTPEKDPDPAEYKAGSVLQRTSSKSISGAKCSVNAREESSSSTSIKSISTVPGTNAPVEYAAFVRMNMHAEGQVTDKSFAPAKFTMAYNYSGPMKYKENQYFDMLFSGSYNVSGTSDGKTSASMNCSLKWLVKALGLTANPAYNYDYVLNCIVTNQATGKSIPADYHIVMEGSKLKSYEIYIAGRKFDYSSLLSIASKLPNADTLKN